MSFDSAMDRIRTHAGASQETVADLRKSVLALAEEPHPNYLRAHLAGHYDKEGSMEPSEFKPPLLQFGYTNWRGDDHEYVIDIEGIECGPYDAGGKHPADKPTWVMHGHVVTRDGDPRPDMGPTRRRTFLLTGIRNMAQTERSA